jgi:hypothetical protein
MYLDDDFQSYAIGSNLPFGSFTGTGSIVAGGNIIPATDRSFSVHLATYNRGIFYVNSFSQYIALKLDASPNRQPFMNYDNGPNGSGNSFTLLQFHVEPDSTITVQCPVSGQTLANSGDGWFKFFSWNFLQINITLSDVLVAGVLKLNIQCDIGLNGVSIISFNTTTTASVANFANATSEVNSVRMQDGLFGAFTWDVLSALIAYPHVGTPSAIVKQGAIELDILPNTANIDVYQGAIELDILPNTAQLRVIQAVIEMDRFIREPWYVTES